MRHSLFELAVRLARGDAHSLTDEDLMRVLSVAADVKPVVVQTLGARNRHEQIVAAAREELERRRGKPNAAQA